MPILRRGFQQSNSSRIVEYHHSELDGVVLIGFIVLEITGGLAYDIIIVENSGNRVKP